VDKYASTGTLALGTFGWGFAPTFTFAKAKNQPKGINGLCVFAQKAAFTLVQMQNYPPTTDYEKKRFVLSTSRPHPL
jgi:hypothetical protein